MAPATKRCRHCGEEKPREEFSPAPAMKDELKSWCGECLQQNNRDWKESRSYFGPSEPLPEERVTCLECGKYGRSLGIHVRVHGGMTIAEYREKYPGAPTVGAAVSELLSLRAKETGLGSPTVSPTTRRKRMCGSARHAMRGANVGVVHNGKRLTRICLACKREKDRERMRIRRRQKQEAA
jgi:hypothetical protein